MNTLINMIMKMLVLTAVLAMLACTKTIKGSDGEEYIVNDAIDMPAEYKQGDPLTLFGISMNQHITDVSKMYENYKCVGSREIRVNCFYLLDTTGSAVFDISEATEMMVSYLRSEVDMAGLMLERQHYFEIREDIAQYFGTPETDNAEVTRWSGIDGSVELFNKPHANGRYALKITRKQ